jgi:cell fate (sporulation/competence/biofilm development) regulator YlbF (YheA/YmcA/DUF963 family)
LTLLILVMVGAGIFFLNKNDSSSDIKPTIVDTGSTGNTSTKSKDSNSIDSIDNTPPPWMGSTAVTQGNKNSDGNSSNELSNSGSGINSQKITSAEESKKKLEELNKIQAEITANMQNGQPDINKLKATLYKMKQTQGDVVGGVNIGILINNLEKAQQIQELALEMQNNTGKVGSFDQKKQEINLKKMQQLQAEMRTDFVASPNINKSK